MKYLLFILFLAAGNMHAVGLEFGADIGYFASKFTARAYPALTTLQTTYFTGPVYSGYGHLTIRFPHSTFGIGPTFAYSNPSSTETSATATSDEMIITRLGGDAKLQLETLEAIAPYIRFNLGKNSMTWNDRGTASTGSYLAASSAGGLFYSVLLGVQFPFSPEFALYAQGGYTETSGSALLTRSFSASGGAQTISAVSSADTTYSGWLFSAGGKLSF